MDRLVPRGGEGGFTSEHTFSAGRPVRNAPEGNQVVSRFSDCVLSDLPGCHLVLGSQSVPADRITEFLGPVSLQTWHGAGGTQVWMLATVMFLGELLARAGRSL